MKSKRKKFVSFLDRLTPEQLAEFRRGMAALRRRFQRRMKRRNNAHFVREYAPASWQNNGRNLQ